MKRLKFNRVLTNKDFIYAITLLLIIGLISFSFYELSKAEVKVTQGDEVTTIRTHANTVGDVLNELVIDVGEHDELSHNLNDRVTTNMKIQHTVANQVFLSIDGKETTYYTTSKTVEDFLYEQNIELTENDQLSLALDTNVNNQLEIAIDKAFQVTINDAGEKQQVWTTNSSVEELLNENNITLHELDKIKPKTTAELNGDTDIVITRVEKVTDVVEEEQDFPVVKRQDSSLEKGKEEIVAQGEPGVIEKHYEVVLENGEEVSRELVKEEVKQEGKEKIVAIGTKVNQTISTNNITSTNSSPKSASSSPKSSGSSEVVSRSGGGNEPKGKTLYMKATAYNWDCSSCDGRGLTATGYNLKANPNGVIAVDPSVIPLGTKVWVEGYGYAIARDTGGNIKGNKIDLHMATTQQASSFGVRTVQVKIIE